MRRPLALSLSVLAALGLPASAFAHATLEQETPSFRERVAVSPREVVLRFDQTVTVLPGSIRVLTLRGKDMAGPARQITRGMAAPLPRLPKGPYTVRWKAVSNDGHVVNGVYTFGVRYPAPPVTDAVGADGPTTAEHVVRWAYFLALALLVGGLGFRLLVVPGELPGRAESLFFRITGIGAFAVLNVGVLAFLLRAEDALQLPFGAFLYGDLSPLSRGTRFGTAFIAMTLGFALVSALLCLAWLTGRRPLLWAAFVLGLCFASGLSLSGHSAADAGSSWLSELADWVHLAAATLWIGGLIQLVAVVWPAAPARRREAFLRFSRLATVLVALLVAAGTYLSILRLPHLHDLWSAQYGQVLLVKLALVAIALLWGAVHRFVAKPLVERGPSPGLLARLPRSLLGESAVAMAVLLAAAVLVDSKPPPQPAPAGPSASNVSPGSDRGASPR
jgi:copper transport protein